MESHIFESISNCDKHGEYKSETILFGKSEINMGCPECEAEQEQFLIDEELKEKNKRESIRIIAYQDYAGIPERFKKCTLENYIIENKGQENALKESRKYLDNYEIEKTTGAAMFYCGSFGTGKTHLSIAILNNLIVNKKIRGIYSTTMKMIRDIRSSYTNNNLSEQKLIDKYVNIELLILDEVGVQMGTDAEKLLIYEVINGRYENYKPTIILSNLSFDGITKYLGARSIDRLKGKNRSMIIMDWESHRSKI